MAAFVPGLDLAASFYAEAVRPRLADIAHSAALMGPGSDVLGYDDIRSTDHYWGPRLQVFVEKGDVHRARTALESLPDEHRGWRTSIGSDRIPFRVHADVWTLDEWVGRRLGVDPRPGLSAVDWLSLPQQLLLETTAGTVFSDGLQELEPLRRSLAWYPHDVWLWLLAAQWRRIAQEEAFVGRAAEVGDDIGSRIVVGRIVRDLMRLCFLMERVYAPYGKWLGSAFGRLPSSADVGPAVASALAASTYDARERSLADAYEAVARMQSRMGVTRREEPSVRPYHGRPYLVIGGGRYADACLEAIGDRRLAALPLVGAVDQWVDSTDVLAHGERARLLTAWFGSLG